MGDFCEKSLAAAFAPELYYWSSDDIRREPHWVARATDDWKAYIGYLLSYYRDEGSDAYICHLPFAPASCNGHNGDSEAIFLLLYYNSSTQHWLLESALYSQHDSYGYYSRGTSAYPPQLIYPSHAGAYPRAYVSEGKHANYRTAGDCNGGGTLGTDTCEHVNTAMRVAAGEWLNVGSRAHHYSDQDCMPSANSSYEYYGSGRLECYWTIQRFRGWIPITVGGDDSDPYSPRLAAQGF
jgi:hypothetical protein